MPKVFIIGAGISGLALAYQLQQALPTVDITLLEQRSRLGGAIWTERREGFQIEIGPNGFLDSKPTTIALCRELGLGDRLQPASASAGRNRFLYLDGKLRPLPHSFGSFLKSDLLSWRGKLSFLAERFRRRGQPRRDESIDAFARRRAGREAADVFADAMVTGIYAGDPRLLSVRAAFPRIAKLEQQHGSVMKGMAHSARQRRREAIARGEPPPRPGQMWSFREGLRLLVETLGERLKQAPLLGVTTKRIERRTESPAWIVHGEGRDCWQADAVVLTCPAYQQAALLAELDAELADRVAGIAYNRVTVIALGYRRDDVPVSLDGFGYIAPQRTRGDVLGVQWCSSIFPQRAPEGAVLLRAMCGGWHRPEVVSWHDARLLDAVRQEFRLTLGITAAPLLHHIVRWDRAIPQYLLGHLDRVAWIAERAARYPGLILAGNAYHGVAMNDCTEQAVLLAEQLKSFLLLA